MRRNFPFSIYHLPLILHLKIDQLNNKWKMEHDKWQIRGFTLIELLIVIGIIGILVGFSAVNLGSVRQHGRDAKRKSDLKIIQSALELVRADRRCYPMVACVGATSLPGCGNPLSYSGSTYIQNIPCDPLSGSSYVYSAPNPNTYTITACLETLNDQERDDDDGDPGDLCDGIDGRVSYTVRNP